MRLRPSPDSGRLVLRCYNQRMSNLEPGADDGGWLLAGNVDPVAVTAYYDQWAARYDAELGEWAYEAPRVAASLVMRHTPIAQVVLDAGCGTGLCGRALRAAGYVNELHGIDLSDESLTVAAASGAYTLVSTANLQEPLGYATDMFDALVCVGVMTYVPDVESCWREFARSVRSGGIIVVTQRDDLWEERSCQRIVDELAHESVWEPIWVSEPEPYLPGNADFGDRIGVRYVATRVVS